MAAIDERLRSTSNSVIFLFGLIAAGFIFYEKIGVSTIFTEEKIQQMRTEIGTLQQKLKTTQDTAKDKAKIQEEMETVSQTFKLVLDYIPKELDGQGLLKKISIEAKSAGVQLATFRPGAAIPKDFYDELPMAINLRGTYPQLILLLLFFFLPPVLKDQHG